MDLIVPLVVPFDGFTFHPHQIEAVNWMMGREAPGAEYVCGGILADEMGLGKTYMTTGLLLNAPVPNTLLIVPPVLSGQWADVLVASGIPHRILGAASAAGPFRNVPGTRAGLSVTLTTYSRAKSNVPLLSETLFDRIVCDEGHIFKNGKKTQTFANIHALAAPRRWLLTGTPVQNRGVDFRNLLMFLNMNEDRLSKSLKVIAAEMMLRRTVDDVRESIGAMPLKPIHTVVPVVMPVESEEALTFSALVGRLESAIENDAKSILILELYLRIRQFSTHPDIYVQAMRRKYKNYGRESWVGTTSKMTAFRRLVSETAQEPTIVFTTFTDEMEHVTGALETAGYRVFNIAGGMSEAARTAMVSDSKTLVETSDAVAIVVQIVAGGAGLNLQHCSRIIFMSSHWNPAIVDQAVARAYRMGQMKEVSVFHLLLADGAERNIDRLMAKKHGMKRDAAKNIHPKLVCAAAIETARIWTELDAAMGPLPPPPAPAAAAAAAAGAIADDAVEELDDTDYLGGLEEELEALAVL